MSDDTFHPTTYPEMNSQIVRILRISNDPAQNYAAQRIEELEATLSAARAEADALWWFIQRPTCFTGSPTREEIVEAYKKQGGK